MEQMERFSVSVLISNSNGSEKSFEESHQGSLKSVITALKNLKDKTNEYLTGLVAEEKGNISQGLECGEKSDAEESDVEIEDDFIDAEIKKELLSEESSSHNTSKSDKRTKTNKKNKKKVKH